MYGIILPRCPRGVGVCALNLFPRDGGFKTPRRAIVVVDNCVLYRRGVKMEKSEEGCAWETAAGDDFGRMIPEKHVGLASMSYHPRNMSPSVDYGDSGGTGRAGMSCHPPNIAWPSSLDQTLFGQSCDPMNVVPSVDVIPALCQDFSQQFPSPDEEQERESMSYHPPNIDKKSCHPANIGTSEDDDKFYNNDKGSMSYHQTNQVPSFLENVENVTNGNQPSDESHAAGECCVTVWHRMKHFVGRCLGLLDIPLVFVLGVILYVVDVGSDIASAVDHFQEGQPVWAALTAVFVVLPTVCWAAVSWSWFYHDTARRPTERKMRMWLSVLLLDPLVRYIGSRLQHAYGYNVTPYIV